MALTTKTLQEIEALVRASIRNYIPEADLSDLSDYDITVRVLAALFLGNQEQAAYNTKQIFASTADADSLEHHKRDLALSDVGPVKAGGLAVITSTVAGKYQAAGSELEAGDGTKYTLDAGVITQQASWTAKTFGEGSGKRRVVVVPDVSGMVAGDYCTTASGNRVIKAVITTINAIDFHEPLDSVPTVAGAITAGVGVSAPVTAVEDGSDGNKTAGDTLTITTPGTDVDASARVIGISGGRGAQTTDELRRQILNRRSGPDGAGNVEDYRRWVKATPNVGVGECYVYPGLRGASTVDLVCLGVAGSRLLSDVDLVAIAEHISGLIPGGDDVLVMTATTATVTGVQATVEVSEGFEPDWTGAAIQSAPGSTTTKINLYDDPRLRIEPGDRVQVTTRVGPYRNVSVREVATVGEDFITITEPAEAAPEDGSYVYPAGPSTQTMLDALATYTDALGPGVFSATGDVPRHPSPSEAGDHTMRRAAVSQTLMNVDGTVNVPTIVLPATDIEPAAQSILTIDLTVILYA